MNRTEFKRKLLSLMKVEDVMLVMSAYDYAKAGHRNQEREEFSSSDLVPEKRYFNHPRRIALDMFYAGILDTNTLCVGLLHDCPEDTSIFGNQHVDGYEIAMYDARFRITRAFNAEVAEAVISLTIPKMDPTVPLFSSKTKCLRFYHEGMRRASKIAQAGKLFDRLDNLQSIEVKGPALAKLKLQETSDFYLPLFYDSFSNQGTRLEKICYVKTQELETLVGKKQLALA